MHLGLVFGIGVIGINDPDRPLVADGHRRAVAGERQDRAILDRVGDRDLDRIIVYRGRGQRAVLDAKKIDQGFQRGAGEFLLALGPDRGGGHRLHAQRFEHGAVELRGIAHIGLRDRAGYGQDDIAFGLAKRGLLGGCGGAGQREGNNADTGEVRDIQHGSVILTGQKFNENTMHDCFRPVTTANVWRRYTFA